MPNKETQNFGFVLHDTARMLRRNFNRRAQSTGLTRTQWRVLKSLHRRNGMRQSQLADLLEIQPISLTRLIDRLEKNGWVERCCDPTDRRANRIFITEKANPVLERLGEFAEETRQEACAGISEKELDQCLKILLRIHTTLAGNGESPAAEKQKMDLNEHIKEK
ncbi:MAG: hypothetical protein PWQ29_1083 [Verrucomicrobiota bacterium]|jgi:DNA-binding MarR family transcriptional regulator|nr:hypothetical protein [Verrucomicrobiota bacterium]MDK2963689.1 hypothetical protein [Verrucomicrobiota bacterium]